MPRAVSNIISILVVLSIAVGLSVAAASIFYFYMESSAPKGGVLTVVGVSSERDPSSGRVYIAVRIVVSGVEPVCVSSATFYDTSGNSYQVYLDTPGACYRPGASTVSGYIQSSGSLSGYISLSYCTQSGKCSSATAPAKI